MQLKLDLRAAVLTFPLSRRGDIVREAAAFILRESDESAAVYWRTLIRSLTDPLLAAGVPREAVQAEARRFSDAVQREMWRTGDHAGGAG